MAVFIYLFIYLCAESFNAIQIMVLLLWKWKESVVIFLLNAIFLIEHVSYLNSGNCIAHKNDDDGWNYKN
jgi:hypothetical protein